MPVSICRAYVSLTGIMKYQRLHFCFFTLPFCSWDGREKLAHICGAHHVEWWILRCVLSYVPLFLQGLPLESLSEPLGRFSDMWFWEHEPYRLHYRQTDSTPFVPPFFPCGCFCLDSCHLGYSEQIGFIKSTTHDVLSDTMQELQTFLQGFCSIGR